MKNVPGSPSRPRLSQTFFTSSPWVSFEEKHLRAHQRGVEKICKREIGNEGMRPVPLPCDAKLQCSCKESHKNAVPKKVKAR